ncbi:hypothetical protein IFR05_014462 [Cadophora sp. M221]|nr:hypothetical protein IFR05_014462 [Cadophora sp. M221]
MTPNGLFRDTLNVCFILVKMSAMDGSALALQAIFFLAIDPYFNDRWRGRISMLIIGNAVRNRPGEDRQSLSLGTLTYWLAILVLMNFEYWILSRPAGPLIATAQTWIQNRILPPAWAFVRATEPNTQILGELVTAFIPLAFFGAGILCFKYFTAAVALLWFVMTDPGLWLMLAIGIGLVEVWKTVLTEGMRDFVTTKIIPQSKQSLARLAIAIFKLCRLPYRYLARFEATIVLWREKNILSRPAYTYARLQPGHIRLLRISRRLPFSGFRCQIVHVPLSAAPPYEAISYCWGADPASKNVVINGTRMVVLNSVNEVLHYRYSFRQERLLWIDSVCINQKDDIEKGEQIQLMRTIFSQAVGVLAWLGDMDGGIIASSFIRTLSAKVGVFGYTAQDLLLEFRESNDVGWTYLGVLLSKPWFTRSWMLQEIALAKHVQLVFGGISLDWKHLANVLYLFRDNSLGRFLGSPDAGYDMGRPMRGVMNATVMEGCRALAQRNSDITLNLILQFSLQFSATKDHDKIYSVLGLVRDGSMEAIQPDYTQSEVTVFTDTMRSLLQTSAPLSLLYLSGTGTTRNHNLPSWVPDWSSSNVRRFQTVSEITYYAGIKFAPRVFVPPEANSPFIRIGGNVVDEILVLGHMGPIAVDSFEVRENYRVSGEKHLIHDWLLEAKDMVAKHVKEPYVVGIPPRTEIQSREEVLWRTIIVDRESDTFPASAKSAEGYAALEWYIGCSSDTKPGDIAPYKQHTLQRTISKEVFLERSTLANTFSFHVGAGSLGSRLAVTKSGLFAVVPPNTRIGDIVGIIWGAQTPYLIRPLDAKIGGGKSWELVGSCFVHGLMNGEGAGGNGTMFTFV